MSQIQNLRTFSHRDHNLVVSSSSAETPGGRHFLIKISFFTYQQTGTCDISFTSKALSNKDISQDHRIVLYKAVALTAGHDLGNLELKVKCQGLTLECQS